MFFTDKLDEVNHAMQTSGQTWEIFQWYGNERFSNENCHLVYLGFKFSNIVSKSDHAPLAGRGRVWGLILICSLRSCSPALLSCCHAMKSFTLYDGFGKSALLWSFEPRNLSGEKFTYGMAVWPNNCYFIRLRGTKEGQECASIGHLEIFSMFSGETQKKSSGTLKVQERYKRY